MAARFIVEERYPDCLAALLGGSVVHGEATTTSNLDILVVTRSADAPFRECFVAHGWPVEAFIHTRASLQAFFRTDAERRRPSLPTMCGEGVVIKDDGSAQTIKQEAEALLEAGPTPLTEAELRQARYTLSDLLDDFVGATNHLEAQFVLAELLPTLCDFVFDTRREWRGGSKWNPRKLAKLDPLCLSNLKWGSMPSPNVRSVAHWQCLSKGCSSRSVAGFSTASAWAKTLRRRKLAAPGGKLAE